MTGVKFWDDDNDNIDDDKCGTDYFDEDHDITADGDVRDDNNIVDANR